MSDFIVHFYIAFVGVNVVTVASKHTQEYEIRIWYILRGQGKQGDFKTARWNCKSQWGFILWQRKRFYKIDNDRSIQSHFATSTLLTGVQDDWQSFQCFCFVFKGEFTLGEIKHLQSCGHFLHQYLAGSRWFEIISNILGLGNLGPHNTNSKWLRIFHSVYSLVVSRRGNEP